MLVKFSAGLTAALFFKQVAAFSAHYAAGEESRCHGIPARASPSHSCIGRDSQRVKSPQGNSPFHACKHFRESCFFLFSFSFSSVNNTSALSATAAIGLSFQRFGTCFIFDTVIAKPAREEHLLVKLPAAYASRWVMKANAPPTCPVTKSKMLQLTRCL